MKKSLNTLIPHVLCMAALVLLGLQLPGCPPADTNGKLTLLLTAEEGGAKSGAIAPDSVLHLYVVIEEVLLRGTLEDGSHDVLTFAGAVEVDLADLRGAAEVIASMDVPPGTYRGVALRIAEPRLVLTDAPDTVIGNVLLPHGGLLEVPLDFTIESGGEGLLILNLGEINIFQWDDGSFSFTPQLSAEVDTQPRNAQAVGRIEDADHENDRFRLASSDASLRIHYSGAPIFVPGDFDTPTGTEADIENGARAFVFGQIRPEGVLDAAVVIILARPDAAEGEGEGEGEGEHDGEDEGEHDAEHARRILEHLGNVDTNGDGVVTLEELRQVFPDFSEELFNAIDTNSDGVLDGLELMIAARHAHERFFRLDGVEPDAGPIQGGNRVVLTGLFPEGVELAVFFGERRAHFDSGADAPHTGTQLVVIAPPFSGEKRLRVPVRVFLTGGEGDALLGSNPLPYEYVGERVTGTIDDLGIEGGTAFRLQTEDGRLLVFYDDAAIVIADGDHEREGGAGDLANGLRVRVVGQLTTSGAIDADIIYLLETRERVELRGVIDDLGIREGAAFRLQTEDGRPLVYYDDADVFLPGDEDFPTGSVDDLRNGMRVLVLGVHDGDAIDASAVRILRHDEPEEVALEGQIDDLGLEEGRGFRLQTDEQRYLVWINEADVYLPGDEEHPTGTAADLVNGARVLVRGVLNADGAVMAELIRILHLPDVGEGEGEGEGEPHPVEVTGVVDDLGIEDGRAFRLQTEEARHLVLLGEVEHVFLPDDGDLPTGSLHDLVNGAVVRVIGFWNDHENLVALTIRILELPGAA